jgi:hypothetical protein
MKLVQTEVEVDIGDEEAIEAPAFYSFRDRLGDRNFILVLLILLFQGAISLAFLFYILAN